MIIHFIVVSTHAVYVNTHWIRLRELSCWFDFNFSNIITYSGLQPWLDLDYFFKVKHFFFLVGWFWFLVFNVLGSIQNFYWEYYSIAYLLNNLFYFYCFIIFQYPIASFYFSYLNKQRNQSKISKQTKPQILLLLFFNKSLNLRTGMIYKSEL